MAAFKSNSRRGSSDQSDCSECDISSYEAADVNPNNSPSTQMQQHAEAHAVPTPRVSIEDRGKPIEPFDPTNFMKSRSPSPRTRESNILDTLLPPKAANTPEYTLVLDLDETLIHFTDKRRVVTESGKSLDQYFNIRPFAQKFLQVLSAKYELVIFTAGTQEYADWVLNQLDLGHWISH